MQYPKTSATRYVLANGLTVILDPDQSAPVLSVQAWVATGSIHENHLLGSGLSHFLEHMVFKGTRDFSSEGLAQAVQAAGGHWNAYTTFDRTVYYIDGPSTSLEIFLKCLTDLVFFPLIPESEFESEKDVIRREIDMGLDDPDHAAIRLLLSTAHVRDARRHPVIGHRHLFDQISHEDLTSYHKSRYTPDRTHLVLSGDFDEEEARTFIEEFTKDCHIVSGTEPLVPHDPLQLGPREAFDTFDIPTSRLSLCWKTPPLGHRDTPAYDLLAAILGKGKSSRLHKHLRNELGLALEISSWTWISAESEGLFAISAECNPENRDALKDAILAELKAFDPSSLSEELAKTKRQNASSQMGTLCSASGRASDLASNWHEARDLDYTRTYLASLYAVKEEDILRVLAQLSEDLLIYTSLDPKNHQFTLSSQKTTQCAGEISSHVLSNGLVVALLPDKRVPLIYFQAAVRAGILSENKANNGLNQLFASTLTKGTTTRSGEDIARTLDSLGASISASVGNNALLLQAAGLSEDKEAILEIFSDVMLHPNFPDEAIHREKSSQIASIQEAIQDPLHRCFSELRLAHFSGKGYGLDSLGTLDSLAIISRSDLTAHHQRHFNVENLTLSISGDFDPTAMISRLERALQAIPHGEKWTAPLSEISYGANHIISLPKKQAILAIAFPGVSVSSEDRFATAFLQEYASDMAGPLFGRIREELGLAYRVGASQFLGYDSGLFTFYLATSPEQLELAQQELHKEILKIAEMGIPEDAFERVRSTVLSATALQRQSLSSNARQSALDLLFGHPANHHRLATNFYKQLTIKQVREVAQRIFSQTPSISIILGTAE